MREILTWEGLCLYQRPHSPGDWGVQAAQIYTTQIRHFMVKKKKKKKKTTQIRHFMEKKKKKKKSTFSEHYEIYSKFNEIL